MRITLLMVAGFLVNLMSLTTPQQWFGILLASTIGLALLADFLLLPALLLILKPFGPERSNALDPDAS